MRQKGSKYARKHRVEIPEPANEALFPHDSIRQKISDNDRVVWDILCEPDHFEKRFSKLTYPQQILMVVTLHDIISLQEKKKQSGYAREFAAMAEQHLQSIHKLTGSSLDEGIYEPLSNDEKRIIRMDCYGKIDWRKSYQLSALYKYFKKSENFKQSKLSDYDLNNSPSWRVFRQFQSFRSISLKIKQFLYKSKINPDALKVMTVSDFCDVIYNAYKKHDGDRSAAFILPENSIRIRLIRSFIQKCGNEFRMQLLQHGNDPRCVDSLCNALQRFGHCDTGSLLVTETYYTPRILKDLKRAGYDVAKIHIGDEIPQPFINELIDANKADLILARDESGKLLDKSRLPKLELHHKHAVQFSVSNGYLARANYPHNLVLVDSVMHAKYYHLFDRIVKQEKMNNYFSRLNINSATAISIIGFNRNDTICYDFEQTKEFQKRQAEDKFHVVNYLKEMEKRSLNEIEIMEKYNIPYLNNSNTTHSRTEDISEKIDENSENIKKFKKWLKQKQRRQSNER